MLRYGRTTICGAAIVLLTALPLAAQGGSDFLSLGIGWSARLASPLLAAPAADSLRVYLPLRAGRVLALSLADGQELWSALLPLTRGVSVDAGRVFTATADEVLALDATTGRVIWRVFARDVVAIPSARAGWVVAAAGPDVLALRASDGRVVWRRTLPAAPRAPFSIDGDRAYAPLVDGSIVALDIRDGTIAWRVTLPAACGPITAVADRLFAGCVDNFLYSLDARDGDRRWRWRTNADVMSPAVQDGSRVYFASLDNIVRALDLGSGVQRWRHPMETRPLRGPVLDQDLLVVSASNELRAVRPRDGTLAGRFTAPAELAAPAVFAPADSGARAVIVTGATTGDWRVYGLMRLPEPAPVPLTEIPGRPLSPDAPPFPPGSPLPGASRLP